MLKIKVNDKDYKIQFGYRALCETDVLDNLTNGFGDEDSIKRMMSVIAELLLAGLQKHHKEFIYETDEERKSALSKVYDLMDDYDAESTEEEPQDIFTLFGLLQDELVKNGFLSRIVQKTEEALAELNATKVPQDHKKKKKA